MERIGLFGGSFDPVHLGHLIVAQAACEELQLAQLFFVLASQSPFKPEQAAAPAEQRLRLLRLALAGQTQWHVDDQEIKRGGVSYTIDTIRAYAAKFPGSRLIYLIGADHVAQLPQWREAHALAKLAEFAVIPRPGLPAASIPHPFHGHLLKGFPIALSSTQIRERIRAGLSIDNLVPPPVAEAIRHNGLYFST